MTGSLSRLDRTRSFCLVASMIVACAESPPSSPRPRDGGFADRDGGSTRVRDGGIADSGSSVRTLIEEDWFPAQDQENYMIASNLDLEMFNLGWQAGGVQGAAVPMIRRIDSGLPGFRREWAEIRSRLDEPDGTFILGFGKAPDGPVRVSLWVAQTDTATAPGDALQVGLHGLDVTGEPRALLMVPDEDPPTVVGAWRWRRWSAEDSEAWTGFVTMLVINFSATPVAITSPHLTRSNAFSIRGDPSLPRPISGILREPNATERALVGRAMRRLRTTPRVPTDSWGLPDNSLLLRLPGGPSTAKFALPRAR